MQFAILQLFLFLRLPEIVVDAGNHLGGEASLMGGVAQLGELMGELTIEIDPTLEFLPGCVWCQGGSVTEGQLCAAVVFVYLFHTIKLLKINELCKFFLKTFDFFVHRDTETQSFISNTELLPFGQ